MASGSKPVIYAALVGNGLIAITKFVAAAITGSSAMLSEGIHSVVDTGNQVLLLFGLRQARKPPDELHPFGHGKEVYFWGFVVAILIFAVGAGLSLYEGIAHLLHPSHVKSVTVNYVVLGLALIFEGAAWLFALKAFRHAKGPLGYLEAVKRGKDPSMFIVLFEDSAAMLGLLVAFFGILLSQLTGDPRFDGYAAILIGLILAATAIWLAWETKGLLIGESANKPVIEKIRRIVAAHPGVAHVNEVLTMHMGPEFILVNLSVDFADPQTADQVEQTVEQVDRQIKTEIPNVKRIFIEAESRFPRPGGPPGDEQNEKEGTMPDDSKDPQDPKDPNPADERPPVEQLADLQQEDDDLTPKQRAERITRIALLLGYDLIDKLRYWEKETSKLSDDEIKDRLESLAAAVEQLREAYLAFSDLEF